MARRVDNQIGRAHLARPSAHGRSAETKQRTILTARDRARRRAFAKALAAMPDVGVDTYFERVDSRALFTCMGLTPKRPTNREDAKPNRDVIARPRNWPPRDFEPRRHDMSRCGQTGFVIASASEAIQGNVRPVQGVDCFVASLLAMTRLDQPGGVMPYASLALTRVAAKSKSIRTLSGVNPWGPWIRLTGEGAGSYSARTI
jgi:antitoxin FitA